jgi:prepilin-type N-terminal cleavage/methylation domain-containing protein
MRQVANKVGPWQRPAFTLIELLVVVAIISILAALAVSGMMQYFEAQRQSNTETNIRAVYQILQQHWAKVVADAKTERPSDAVLVALADNDMERARVIWIKLRLMEAFPENFTEILSTDPMGSKTSPLYYKPLPPIQVYIPPGQQKYMAGYLKTLKKLGISGSTPPRASEASACLLMALSVNRGGTVLTPDTLGPSIQDTDGDGMREIVDGWGNPLGFYRFPTGNNELTSKYNPNPSARFYDPLDPDGRLVVPTWLTSSSGSANRFKSLCHDLPAQSPKGLYLVPVIASAAKDGKLGMQPRANPLRPDPMMPLASGDDYDNIYSYRLRLGARGD